MANKLDLTIFQKRGYDLFVAQDKQALDELRNEIFEKAKSLVPYKGETVEIFFNGFHSYGLTSTELNKFRLEMIGHCTKHLNVNRRLHSIFKNVLTELVGSDVAAQRGVNIVIQPPGDPDVSPVHRDAPANSHFEVVVWLPLVDVFGTKSMYILDKPKTEYGMALLQSGKSYGEFASYTTSQSQDLAVNYGSACFFAAGMAHGVHINKEKETRWSLNLRFKNLFSPYGPKGLLEYFEIIQLSPLSKVAFELEKKEYEQQK